MWLTNTATDIFKYLHDERGEEIKAALPDTIWRTGAKGTNMLTCYNRDFNLTDPVSYNNALQWVLQTAERFYAVLNPMINDFKAK